MQNSFALILGNCHRSPSDLQFYSRFYDCLEKVWFKHWNVLLVGDFNSDHFCSLESVISYAREKLRDIFQQFS